jgi:serine/threonine protein kinase
MELKYTLLERLGDGTYGEVWKGKSNSTGKIVAIKIQKKNVLNTLKYEARVLLALKGSDCIPPIFSVGKTRSGLNYMVIKYYENTLKITSSVEEWKSIVRGTFDAIYKLHKLGYVHRDIKPDNFMIDSNDHLLSIILVDLGMAVPMIRGGIDFKGEVGSRKYMADRVKEGSNYSYTCDWESWLLTCIELLETEDGVKMYSRDDDSIIGILNAIRKLPLDTALISKDLLNLVLLLQ